MPTPVLVLRTVVASPTDVKPERDALPSIFDEVNRDTAGPARLHLELSRWETDSHPGFHAEGPQGLIDPILNIMDCDLLIGIFWSRMGTPTPSGRTGTEHEFDTAFESWKRNRRPQIMAYFCTRAPSTTADQAQVARVQTFKEQFPREGLHWPYASRVEFEKLVATHLRNYLRRQIDTIWGKDFAGLLHEDRNRASTAPVVAILGRTSNRTPHDRDTNKALAGSGLRLIGHELAKAGWQLLVYDSGDEYASTEVVRGYVESGHAGLGSIHVRYPRGIPQQPFPTQSTNRTLFVEDAVAQSDWETTFFPSLSAADGVVVVGNGQFTLFGGLQAVGARMPVLALAGYGGVTTEVWDVLRQQPLRLPSQDELTLMAEPLASEEWARACVSSLTVQKQRRDARQIWRV